MHDLIIQSNLLSGGIENRFLHQFSQEAQNELKDIIKISQDKRILSMLSETQKENEDDKLVSAIIH